MKGISIIIPVYNREKYIAEAIQSVIDQNYKGDIEIIISDDGSTDKTLDIAESFGNKVKILRKTEKDQGQGASKARNRGLRIAKQPYIAFLDSDDFYLQNHFNRIVPVLENNSDLDYAFCRTLQVKEVVGEKLFKPWTQQKISKYDIINPDVSGGDVVNTDSFVFNKYIFEMIGGFNETHPIGEDSDMWMRISELFKGSFVDYYGVAYRLGNRNDQLTSASKELILHHRQRIINSAIDRYFQLGLKNPYRIYKLKIRRSNLINGKKKSKHYINCFLITICYPISFLQTIPSLLRRFLPQIEKEKWNPLSYYIRNKN